MRAGQLEQASTLSPQVKRDFPTMARAYAAAGRYEQALLVTQTIEELPVRAEVLGEIARKRLEAGEMEQGGAILAQAVHTAQKIPDTGEKAKTLARLVRVALAVKQEAQALHIAGTIEDAAVRAQTLAEVAHTYIEAGRYEQALQLANTITDFELKAQVEAAVIRQYLAAGQVDQAQAIALRLEDPAAQTRMLIALARYYTEAGDKEKAAALLSPALQGTAALADTVRARTLAEIALHYTAIGQYDQAVQVAGILNDAASRTEVLMDVIHKALEAGGNEQALQMA